MSRPVSAIQTLYDKYQYLAKSYSEKVYNFERYGYEKEDVIQEFRIKIYTSIISYSEKWAEYRQTGKYKPVPIEYYLKTAMVNKYKDFVKLFNMSTVENVDKTSIEQDGFDYSEYNTTVSVISLSDDICEINGVDLMEGLIGRKRRIFSMYLEGYTQKEISNEFPNLDVEGVISRQLEQVRSKKETLFDFQKHEFTMVTQFED